MRVFKYIPLIILLVVMIFTSGDLYNKVLYSINIYDFFLYFYIFIGIVSIVLIEYAKMNVNVYNLIPNWISDGFIVDTIKEEITNKLSDEISNKFTKINELKEYFNNKYNKILLSLGLAILMLVLSSLLLASPAFSLINLVYIISIYGFIYFKITD